MEKAVGAEVRQTDTGQITGTDWRQESYPQRVGYPKAAA